jgi:hypothetical protein
VVQRTADTLTSASALIDLERYPIDDLASAGAQSVVAEQRTALRERGVALMHGFVRPEVVEALCEEATALQSVAYLEDVWGTPYLSLPDESFPPDHPRRYEGRSLTWVVGYDQVPQNALLRALYEWDGLKDFVAAIVGAPVLHRFADPLGALNVALMHAEHTQAWHFDNTEFVVSLALQSSEAGGLFECAPAIRDAEAEHYDDVAAVLSGEGDRLEVYPMTPGTLMIFAGRNSLHRVSPVEGDTPRYVALLSYDERPDADSSELFKLVRYGRSEPVAPTRW